MTIAQDLSRYVAERQRIAGEPVVSEEWDNGSYVTVVTLPNSDRYVISQTTSGAFVGDYEISGPNGFYSDGFTSVEKAVKRIVEGEL